MENKCWIPTVIGNLELTLLVRPLSIYQQLGDHHQVPFKKRKDCRTSAVLGLVLRLLLSRVSASAENPSYRKLAGIHYSSARPTLPLVDTWDIFICTQHCQLLDYVREMDGFYWYNFCIFYLDRVYWAGLDWLNWSLWVGLVSLTGLAWFGLITSWAWAWAWGGTLGGEL